MPCNAAVSRSRRKPSRLRSRALRQAIAAPPAALDLARHRDARHRGAAGVVVRHQERDVTELLELIVQPRSVWPGGRFDLAHDLERWSVIDRASPAPP